MKKIMILFLVLALFACTKTETVNEDENMNNEQEVIETPYVEAEYEPSDAFSNEEWYNRFDVYEINRMEARSSFVPYESFDKALACEKSALDDMDYTQSERVLNLNGDWDFEYHNVNERLWAERGLDYSCRYEDWELDDTISVPGVVETLKDANGDFKYNAPHYTNINYPWLENELTQFNWDNHPVAATASNHVMYYKRTFEITEALANDVTIASFEGVLGAFYLYVNGQIVGYSEDSTACAEFDISDYVQLGENTIAVEVMQYSDASYFEDQDAIRCYGIYRDVNILFRPDNYIKDIETSEAFSGEEVTLNTNVTVNEKSEIKIELFDKNNLVGTGDSITITNPKLWSDEDPYLYRLFISVYEDGEMTECTMIRIGLRNITWDSENVYINGEPIFFKGVNRTETSLEGLRCVSKEEIINDLTTIKSLNMNAFRMAHYPNNKLTYDVADELGLYVIDECNIESHLGALELEMPGCDPTYNDLLLDRTKNMVERDLNHASVIMYSLGNESTYSEYPMDENYGMYMDSLWILEKDPSRLRIYERDNRYGSTRETSMVDIASSQYLSIDDMISMAATTDIPYIQEEFAHAMGNAAGNFSEYIEAMKENDVAGGFVWDLKDQSTIALVKGTEVWADGEDFGQSMNDGHFCADGLLNADGSLTSDAYEVKSVYQNVEAFLKDDKIVIANHYLLTNLNEFDSMLQYLSDGKVVKTKQLSLDCESGDSVEITYDDFESDGERRLILTIGSNVIELPLDDYEHDLTIGDNNDSVTISTEGGSIDLKWKDIEINDLTFDLYRAPLDNDESYNTELYDVKLNIVNMDESEDVLLIEGNIENLNIPFRLEFTKGKDAVLIDANIDLRNIEGLNVVGLKMKTSNDFTKVNYYGEGPYESYPDKKDGTLVREYTERVDEYFNTKYIKPQESGSHTDVRYFNISDDEHRISFEMNENMNMKVTHYDDMVLTDAHHMQDVIVEDHDIIKCDYLVNGIGNGSNGPGPLKQYLINQSESISFELKILFE